ncbi:mam4 Protein-S-isoprenylcysteine O-methyltransferase [Candida maltosa Xu316]
MYDPKKNNLLEVFIVCFGLGISWTCCCCGIYFTNGKYSPLFGYFIALHLHFISEFTNTYLYQPNTVSSRSFLIYGNRGGKEFWIMQGLAIWEFLLVRFVNKYIAYPLNIFKIPGVILMISGLLLRHSAMKTCGLSFSHYLATKKEPYHKLVTTGVYKYIRHPSYLGFWLFCVGIQLWLSNYINLIFNLYILHRFFSIRINHEEQLLVNFYGDEYRKYQQHTYILIPWVVTTK